MECIDWNTKLSMSVFEMDDEHKKIIEMINSLQEEIRSGKCREISVEIIDEITEDTLKHFMHEENLLAQYRYPQYQEHKEVHDEFVKTITEIRKKHQQRLLHSGQLLNTLQDWFINHINTTDKNYGLFLMAAMRK